MKKQLIISALCILAPLTTQASCGNHEDGSTACGMPDHTKHMDHSMHMQQATPEVVPAIDHSTMDHSMHMPKTTVEIMPAIDHSMHMPQQIMDESETTEEKVEHSHNMMDPTVEDPEALPVMDHAAMGHTMNMTFRGKRTESSEAYFAANMDMHAGMNIAFTHDADIDFLKGMIPHHQGAIDMAKIQLEHGKDGSLKHVTGRIIRDQEREIAWMKDILTNEEKNTLVLNKMAAEEAKEHNTVMHEKMNIRFSGNADIDFVKGMIPHHEGAVEMAQTVLKYGNNPAAKRIAYDIINAQRAEIYWMQQWLRRVNQR